MRIVFCGSGTFATPTLEALCGSVHKVVAAVTPPPRPAGRGGKVRPTPVAAEAEAAGVEVYPCENINAPQAVEYLRAKQPDVLCVVEFGQFVREPARRAVRLDAINLHASLLPALRGAAPVNWAILRGLERTGVTTFSLVDAVDAGPVYGTVETPIAPDERAGELRLRLARLGAGLVLETLERIGAGARPQPQDETAATFAPLLKKSDGFLDFSAPAEEIVNRIRGAWPWPGGQAVFLRPAGRAVPVTFAAARAKATAAQSEPGGVEADGTIATGRGRLEIAELQPAGKRWMAWRDFVNGYRVGEGMRFVGPGDAA
jgi:methionyl-tRNA formyltransferase